MARVRATTLRNPQSEGALKGASAMRPSQVASDEAP